MGRKGAAAMGKIMGTQPPSTAEIEKFLAAKNFPQRYSQQLIQSGVLPQIRPHLIDPDYGSTEDIRRTWEQKLAKSGTISRESRKELIDALMHHKISPFLPTFE
jgi:hypothetical protein